MRHATIWMMLRFKAAPKLSSSRREQQPRCLGAVLRRKLHARRITKKAARSGAA